MRDPGIGPGHLIFMTKEDLIKKKLPDAPGVYFFLGQRKKILYIGKATSLRDRVKSYFAKDLHETRGVQIVKMAEEASSIDWRETDSVLEALLLEANLIKTHKPPYNTRDKDDKSFNYVIITNEDFPRVLTVRGKELPVRFSEDDIKYEFGPFPQGGLLKEALKLIHKIFPFYDTKRPVTELVKKGDAKIRFNRMIGLYPDGKLAEKEYARTIQHIKLLFEGKKKDLLRELKKDMQAYAKSQAFEMAEKRKRQIFALEHIQDVSLMKRQHENGKDAMRIEAYDIAHMAGDAMVGVMTVVENGQPKKSDYRKFIIQGFVASNDTGALSEVLSRRLHHTEWPLPHVIVVDGGKAQINAAQNVLDELGHKIPVMSVLKDEHHKPKEVLGDTMLKTKYGYDILLANAEAHRFAITFHRKRLLKKATK